MQFAMQSSDRWERRVKVSASEEVPLLPVNKIVSYRYFTEQVQNRRQVGAMGRIALALDKMRFSKPGDSSEYGQPNAKDGSKYRLKVQGSPATNSIIVSQVSAGRR